VHLFYAKHKLRFRPAAIKFRFGIFNVISVGLNLAGPKIYRLFRETPGPTWIPSEIIKF
jgi:hypothetical protein